MTIPVVSRSVPDRHENPESGSFSSPSHPVGFETGLF